MYHIKYQRTGTNMCPKLQPVYDNCCNYYMNRGLHVNGQFIDSVGIISPMVGDIKQSVRATDFEGWLICDGAEVSIYQYAELYGLIGSTFGSASPGFFRLPDARGRVLGTVQQSAGTSYYCVGNTTGEETHTLTIPEIPAHNHGITDPGHAHAITDPGHTHTSNATGAQSIGGSGYGLAFSNGANTASTGLDSSPGEPNLYSTVAALSINSNTTGVTVNTNTTGITTQNTGDSLPHNNMQPTLFIGNTFIYSGVRDSRKTYVCSVEDQTIQPCLD